MTNTRGNSKVALLASKKQKAPDGTSSSSASVEVMSIHDEPSTITFRLGGLVRHMSIPEFGAALGLYTEEFMSVEDFLQLHRHIHHSPLHYWTDLTGDLTNCDASHSKATHLSSALRYLQALLAHTLTGQR
ncbi:hypothetical protein PVK06_001791 [Gossypium arboreum]|uniref:Uncharacterized protein n=1 Tax=Gossypium arboreum TaxID=29729 RepID=A0ABR0R338_GOSAR|nr:hypothetical protein PVK06_001791 [Gossypium arboreum]